MTRTMSTSAECCPTPRMKLVMIVISMPQDFLRGPQMECATTSAVTSVAIKRRWVSDFKLAPCDTVTHFWKRELARTSQRAKVEWAFVPAVSLE
jgi:hypothetical protein